MLPNKASRVSMVAISRGPDGTIGGFASAVVVVDDGAAGAVAVVVRGDEPGSIVVVDSAGDKGNVSDVQALTSKLVNSNVHMGRDRMAAR